MKKQRRQAKTLYEMKAGQSAVVTAVHSTGAMKRRLVDMGIIPGTEILVRRVAPLGDPLQVSLRGYDLLVRGSEARDILVRALRRV